LAEFVAVERLELCRWETPRPKLTQLGYQAKMKFFTLIATLTGLAGQKPSNHHIMTGQCWVKYFTTLAACLELWPH
jgi:hypothetical protein